MNFTPTQIGVTFASFAITLFMAYWWQKVDKNSENRQSDVESFPVLMSVFFWSAFLALALKMLIDLGVFYAPEFMQQKALYLTTLGAEELVKAMALIIGLNIAGKRFNELSDGVMYAVFAALGFIFFENIVYLLTTAPNLTDFIITFMGRNLFSFAAHLSIVIFGVFYASAYLHPETGLLSKLRARNEHRIKPYELHMIFKFLWDKFSIWMFFWIPFSPLFTVYQIARGKRGHLTMSEILISGFLLAVYVHIGYDLVLDLNMKIVNSLLLFCFGLFIVFLFHFFPEIDVENQTEKRKK